MSRIVNITPEHPGPRDRANGATSTVRVAIDTGLKSGKVTIIALTPREALRWSAALAMATHQATSEPGGSE